MKIQFLDGMKHTVQIKSHLSHVTWTVTPSKFYSIFSKAFVT